MRLIDADYLKQLRDDVISGKLDIRTEGDLIDACPTINPYEWISVEDKLSDCNPLDATTRRKGELIWKIH